jgi:hypothetical protein
LLSLNLMGRLTRGLPAIQVVVSNRPTALMMDNESSSMAGDGLARRQRRAM